MSDRFGDAALRLSGAAGLMFGWAPDLFWNATPDELGALVRAVRGDGEAAPIDASLLSRLKEQFPDG